MAGDSSLQLQRSLFSAISGTSLISSLVTGVFDHVPSGQVLPYITIGQETAIDNSTHTKKGMDQTISVHTWSNATGRREAKMIMEQIYELLHEKTLPLIGHVMIMMRFEYSETIPDLDNVTYHGIQRFRVLTTEA